MSQMCTDMRGLTGAVVDKIVIKENNVAFRLLALYCSLRVNYYEFSLTKLFSSVCFKLIWLSATLHYSM